MSQSEKSASTTQSGNPPRESKSTLYVASSACLAAAILGFTFFLLVRGFQWRAALSDLRAEPGIEILSVERVGFFKKRLLGLRDPLAPTAESILLKHNIGPHTSEVVLTEYHSLNTIYAEERAKSKETHLEAIRDDLVASVGEFAASVNKKREEDLEKITQMLFDTRFPQAMKTVDLEWRGGSWWVKGELYAPARETFVAEAPAYIIEGEVDFSGLIDLTVSRTSSLKSDIESANLFVTDIDGNYAHIDRICRLVADFDEVCEKSQLPRPRVQLVVKTMDLNRENERVTAVTEGLQAAPHLPGSRFLPIVAEDSSGGPSSASLKLIPAP